MFSVTINEVQIMAYTLETLQKYMSCANDPRFEPDDLFLKVSDGLYIRRTMTRGDLYKAMGYQTFDFAYPEPWADTVQAKILFAQHGDRVKMKDPVSGEEITRSWRVGDPRPSLVWCYDPPKDSDRHSVFGYPVFDRQVLSDLGRVIKSKLLAGEIVRYDHIFDKKDNDPDLVLYPGGEINNV